MRLTEFRVLTFDCYGTLIDWESGIYAALQPLLARAGTAMDRDQALERFARIETAQEAATPAMVYPELLAEVHRQLGQGLGVATTAQEDARFGASVPDWPAFVDSAPSLQYLKKYFRLVILSNVHRAGFAASNARLGVEFDAIFTAQDIGSYKPAPRNFAAMLEGLAAQGIGRRDILHTAQSLFHDHRPARQAGLATAWIDRRHLEGGWGATMPAEGAGYDFHFTSLDEMVKAHQRDLRA